MSIRTLLTLTTLFSTFFGLLSVVGNVHVAEFYGISTISIIASLVVWFKLARYKYSSKKLSAADFQ